LHKILSAIIALCILLGALCGCAQKDGEEFLPALADSVIEIPALSTALYAMPEAIPPFSEEPDTDEATAAPAPAPTPSPTPAPTETPMTEVKNVSGYVNCNGVNFRKEASTDSEVLDTFQRGVIVTITGKNDEWYRLLIDGVEGYIVKKFISIGEFKTPSPEPTPSPTPKPTPSPTPKPTPTPTPKPTKTPKPTATPTPKPTKTPKPTATPTPKPTKTPKPTATPTPKPTKTPKPTATPTPKPTSLPYFHITDGQFSDEDVILVAKLITIEARTASNKGQRAIASIVVNRVMNETHHFPTTVPGVIYQHNQFVSESTLAPVVPTDKAIANARYVLQEHGPTLPQKVLFYRAKSLGHNWYDYLEYYCTIDDDCFFLAIRNY
jgi:spore germination cell wall hydrolase CwlJ-like protein